MCNLVAGLKIGRVKIPGLKIARVKIPGVKIAREKIAGINIARFIKMSSNFLFEKNPTQTALCCFATGLLFWQKLVVATHYPVVLSHLV